MRHVDARNFDFDIFIQMELICHFASAGGDIPTQMVFDPFHNDFRRFIKSSNNEIRFKHRLNPNIEEIFAIKAENQNFRLEEFDQQAYLHDFKEFAERGIFSFDRTYLSEPENMHFHLVAYPIFDERFGEFINRLSRYNKHVSFLTTFDVQQLNVIIERVIQQNFKKPRNFRRLFF